MARSNIRQQIAVTEKAEKTNSGGGAGGSNYAALSWTELRRVASERDVVSWRRTREQVEADLVALDQGA